jgi:cytochrome P450
VTLLREKAHPRKLARWTADRARHAIRAAAQHALSFWVRCDDTLRRNPPLPPGSLSIRCMREAVTDDRYYMGLLRRHGPIFKLFWGTGHVKSCVVGFPLGRRMLNEHRGALRLVNMQDITPLVPNEYLRSMDPAIHPKYRRIFLGGFHDDLVAPSESALRAMVRRELAELLQKDDSASQGRRLYLALDAIAIKMLQLTMLGVPPDSALASSLQAEYRRLGPGGVVERVGREQIAPFHAIRAAIDSQCRSVERDPQSPVADSVLRRLVERTPADIDETVLGNLVYMVERGRHDLRGLLRWILWYLSRHPDIVSELRTLSGMDAGARLAQACVQETLRLDQAEALNRKVLRSFEFEGFRFPKDSWVSIMMRESHRDPRHFADPEAFRPQRFLEQSYAAMEYAPFGIDEHQCVGASLVTRFCTLYVEELVNNFTWDVADDGPRQYDLHWGPSLDFAIDIGTRSPAASASAATPPA